MATAEPASEGMASSAEMSADKKIANALSAGPEMVVGNATVLDFGEDGLVTLREGSSDWTCWPDNAGTPTNDPMCGDGMWKKFVEALVSGQEPEIPAPGIGYMLQGESAASNSDPTLTEPPAGADWMIDGPHIMLLLPEPFDQTILSTEHSMEGPYIMWAGTAYEHLMVPLAMPKEE